MNSTVQAILINRTIPDIITCPIAFNVIAFLNFSTVQTKFKPQFLELQITYS